MVAQEQLAVLDTNTWSHLYAPRHKRHVRFDKWSELLLGRRVVIALQTRAEVLVGVSTLGPARGQAILDQLGRTTIIHPGDEILQAYVALTVEARRQAHAIEQPVHVADRWIAATAIALEAPLLTADGVFDRAPELELLEW